MEEMSFEDALEELEGIVQKLEEGQLSLEESLDLFERGIFLSKELSIKLKDAEQRIEKLVERNGELMTEPLGD